MCNPGRVRRSQVWLLVPLLALACGGNDAPTAVAPGPPSEAASSTPAHGAAEDGSVDDGPEAKLPAPDGPAPGAPALADVADAPPTEPSAIAPPRGDTSRVSTPAPVPLTSAEVLAVLDGVLAAEPVPSDPMWASRAATAMERDPKLPEQIADRLIEETSAWAGRELGLTVLATKGTAQAPIRRVLNAPAVRAAPYFSSLLSRIRFMPGPEDETVELVYALRSSTDMATRLTATSVLGSYIERLDSAGRTDAARALATRLQADFKASSDLTDQAWIIQAIGEGNLRQTRAFVRGFTRSEHPQLRIAAAKGLSGDDTTKGVTLLLALSVDPDAEVQTAAVEALHSLQYIRALGKAEQQTLHRSIMKDRLLPTNDGVLVHLIDKQLEGTARTDALQHLRARHDESSWVMRHIEDALAR